jgi:hypothetical protein
VTRKEQIREIFMAEGFAVKEGETDLKDYVYEAAYALIEHIVGEAEAICMEMEAKYNGNKNRYEDGLHDAAMTLGVKIGGLADA